jgi:flavin reductase (DIM6/NTAB) family NADH-FMN oxidoreductase RutF
MDASMNYHVFDAASIDHRQAYRLCVGSIVPRPIAWVSSIDPHGVANLAPFSFFTLVSHFPPMISISVGERESRAKDTAANIEATKGFVVHTVVDGWEEAMNDSAANYAPEQNEFDEIGLETVPSDLVGAPRIKGAPVAMECTWDRTLVFGDEWRTYCVIGEIRRWHIREDLLTENKYIDPYKLAPVGRLGGPRYCRTHDIFEMNPPYVQPDRADPNDPLPDRGPEHGAVLA